MVGYPEIILGLDLAGNSLPTPDKSGYRTCPVTAAGSDGRRNTIQRVDLIMLPRENPSV